MHSGDNCRTIPRNVLYKQNKLPSDNITLCSCVCDKCNIYPERYNGSSKLVAGYIVDFIHISFIIYIFIR